MHTYYFIYILPITALCIEKCEFCETVAVESPSKWRLVGIAVGIRTQQLDAIEQYCRGSQIDCFARVYDIWMNNPTIVPFTWGSVVQVLERRFIEERELATHLANSHSIYRGKLIFNCFIFVHDLKLFCQKWVGFCDS